jgi:hypothetical protein
MQLHMQSISVFCYIFILLLIPTCLFLKQAGINLSTSLTAFQGPPYKSTTQGNQMIDNEIKMVQILKCYDYGSSCSPCARSFSSYDRRSRQGCTSYGHFLVTGFSRSGGRGPRCGCIRDQVVPTAPPSRGWVQ